MHSAGIVLLAVVLATLQIAAARRLPQRSVPATSRCVPEEYKVLLDNCGPRSQEPPTAIAPPITTQPIVEPTRVLRPPRIPPARVVSHKCFCVKTIMRPQVFRRVIAVPQLVRFVKKTYRPVVQKIHFCAKPAAAKANLRQLPAGFTSLNRPSALGALDSFVF